MVVVAPGSPLPSPHSNRLLLVSLAENRAHLCAIVPSSDSVWFDIDADLSGLPVDVRGLILDVPLSVTGLAKRVSQLLNILPRELPKLFVIDKAHRVEVVRAGVLGASATTNRPLQRAALRAFMGVNPSRGDQITRQMAAMSSASACLASALDSALTGAPIDYAGVDNACDEVAVTLNDDGLDPWLSAVREHHQGTLQHCLIVAGIMTRFGQKVGMSAEDVKSLTRIGLLHDVGKASIPAALLDKPSRLTDEEFATIKRHPYLGFKFLNQHRALSTDELAAVVGHHEYLDGSGYPYGLMGRSIGDLVRITTICDVYGALIERRSYKREMSPEDALAIVTQMGQEGKVEMLLVRALRGSLG